MHEIERCVVLDDGVCRITLYPPASVAEHGLEHQVDVLAGPFQGTITAIAYENPYRRFHEQLVDLYRTLSGEARLGSAYENLDMIVSGDGRGHVAINVAVSADRARPITLEFKIVVDQTQLREIIDQIERTFMSQFLCGSRTPESARARPAHTCRRGCR
jgi:hypothetical protein